MSARIFFALAILAGVLGFARPDTPKAEEQIAGDRSTTLDDQNELSKLVSAAWDRVNASETKAKHPSAGNSSSGE